MARLAGIHSSPPASPPPLPAITVKQCLARTASLRPWKPTCSQDFREHLLCNPLHGLGLVKRPNALFCLSKCLTDEMGSRAPKNFVFVAASAMANSDQSPPSHEEDNEGAVGCCKDEVKEPPKKPSPEIEPGDVVQAQLQALRDQDFVTVYGSDLVFICCLLSKLYFEFYSSSIVLLEFTQLLGDAWPYKGRCAKYTLSWSRKIPAACTYNRF